jgi:hypothetical protein
MRRKKPQDPVKSTVTSPLKQVEKGWQWRERKTRVVQSPIKGKDTNAKQWGRWTP